MIYICNDVSQALKSSSPPHKHSELLEMLGGEKKKVVVVAD